MMPMQYYALSGLLTPLIASTEPRGKRIEIVGMRREKTISGAVRPVERIKNPHCMKVSKYAPHQGRQEMARRRIRAL